MLRPCTVCREDILPERAARFAEGPVCLRCCELASSVVEVRWMGGKKFHRTIQGVERAAALSAERTFRS